MWKDWGVDRSNCGHRLWKDWGVDRSDCGHVGLCGRTGVLTDQTVDTGCGRTGVLTDQTVDTLGCVEGLGCTADRSDCGHRLWKDWGVDRSDCGHVGLGLCGRTVVLTDQTVDMLGCVEVLGC